MWQFSETSLIISLQTTTFPIPLLGVVRNERELDLLPYIFIISNFSFLKINLSSLPYTPQLLHSHPHFLAPITFPHLRRPEDPSFSKLYSQAPPIQLQLIKQFCSPSLQISGNYIHFSSSVSLQFKMKFLKKLRYCCLAIGKCLIAF